MEALKLYFIVGHEFGEKVVGNLVNLPTFCKSCDLACGYCRISYGSYVRDIVGLHPIPPNLPPFIDNPSEYLPKSPPKSDIVIPIGIHPDILAEIPSVASKAEAKAVIVPIENRSWCPPALRSRLQDELSELGIEHAFPKPFCELEESGSEVINEFIRRYSIGRPKLEMELEGYLIKNIVVKRSAPCGDTWYVAQKLRFTHVKDLNQNTSNAHHGYPCTASMDVDPEIGDTILHKAGYIIRQEVHAALVRALEAKNIPITAEVEKVLAARKAW
ncbi:MAG: DUF166 domain-containing protein [Nitrososphaerales archaeon]